MWANCPSHCSGRGLEGAADGRGEDEVTVEVVTSGLVGCMLVGSPVDRPHTLSTCGDDIANTHTHLLSLKNIEQHGRSCRATSINCQLAPAQLHINANGLFKLFFFVFRSCQFQMESAYVSGEWLQGEERRRELWNREQTTWENGGREVRDVMIENGVMSELLPGGLTVNGEHSTTSWRWVHMRAVGSDGRYLQWAIKISSGEEETAGSWERRGVCFKPRGKINDNSLA